MGKARKAAVRDLVAANHILFNEGIFDAYGHVSARDPDDPGRFLLARHVAPGIVTRADILTFDLDGNVLDGHGEKLYTELWIHAAMYAAQPAVNGVVHSHSHSIIPFGATKSPLRPIWAPASFLSLGVAQFDTRDVAGDTDLMIRTPELGKALAEAMGDRPVALMRGHGATVVGSSLREAVFRAVYIEANAKIQTEALRLGEPVYISEGEARKSQAHMDADPSYRRAWEFWTRNVKVR
jgi:HCOMODA/2-hydroxy-3-carboxy-muconic semialdehyde decarboxylase